MSAGYPPTTAGFGYHAAPTSAPPMGGGMPMGAPPTAAGPPTAGGYPPMGGIGAPPTGAPPAGQYGPPGSGGGNPLSPPTGGGVQFFSLAGGTPVATQPTSAPPMSMGGAGMPPPPTTMAGPPLPGTMGGIPPTGAMPMPGAPAAFAGPAFVDKEGPATAMPGQPAGGQMVALSEIDTNIRVNPAHMRCTVGVLPNSQTQGAGARMPLAVIARPMALDDSDPDAVDVVDFGSTGIVRCKRCR